MYCNVMYVLYVMYYLARTPLEGIAPEMVQCQLNCNQWRHGPPMLGRETNLRSQHSDKSLHIGF